MLAFRMLIPEFIFVNLKIKVQFNCHSTSFLPPPQVHLIYSQSRSQTILLNSLYLDHKKTTQNNAIKINFCVRLKSENFSSQELKPLWRPACITRNKKSLHHYTERHMKKLHHMWMNAELMNWHHVLHAETDLNKTAAEINSEFLFTQSCSLELRASSYPFTAFLDLWGI